MYLPKILYFRIVKIPNYMFMDLNYSVSNKANKRRIINNSSNKPQITRKVFSEKRGRVLNSK